MAEEATCSVCAENYDADVRCPRVLRCGHSLCQSCLSRIIRVPAVKACPECRFVIKPNRAADFPKNFALLQLLPEIPASEPCSDTSCNGRGGAPADDSRRKRKRSRGGGRRRHSRQRDALRERVRAWYQTHQDWQSCGCEACAEWAHGIRCRCDECDQQMIERGMLCFACGVRYNDWNCWPFGYCSRGCWGDHMQFVPEW